jgi:hypothetical protein
MKPTIGRIVHYTNLGDKDGKYPPEAQAAIITKVKLTHDLDKCSSPEFGYDVSLRIFYEDGEFIMRGVPFTHAAPGTDEARGHWAWPPMVPR